MSMFSPFPKNVHKKEFAASEIRIVFQDKMCIQTTVVCTKTSFDCIYFKWASKVTDPRLQVTEYFRFLSDKKYSIKSKFLYFVFFLSFPTLFIALIYSATTYYSLQNEQKKSWFVEISVGLKDMGRLGEKFNNFFT